MAPMIGARSLAFGLKRLSVKKSRIIFKTKKKENSDSYFVCRSTINVSELLLIDFQTFGTHHLSIKHPTFNLRCSKSYLDNEIINITRLKG